MSRPLWGYIEGYYGRLFTWDERSELLSHLIGLGGNAYLYAPKEDVLHRRDWRGKYPASWRRSFARFVSQGRASGAAVIPGVAPGLSFDYLNAGDYQILLAKLKMFQSLGCATLALLMDDIPAVLPAHCKGKFRSLGEAHGLLLRCLQDDLRLAGRGRQSRKGCDIGLWFCPTVYTDQFASGPVEKDAYLTDLAASMPKDITLMWTGPRIISPSLRERDLRPVSRLFGGNVVIWDNLYANDYCPNKLFVGPYRGRPSALWKLSRGVLLNPTGFLQTDKLLLALLAAFRKGESVTAAWRRVLSEFGVPGDFLKVSRFLDSPFFQAAAGDATPAKISTLRKHLRPMIWDWKSPLQREWYPFLFMLDADLKAASRGTDKPDAAWMRKRYSPVLARLLLGR